MSFSSSDLAYLRAGEIHFWTVVLHQVQKKDKKGKVVGEKAMFSVLCIVWKRDPFPRELVPYEFTVTTEGDVMTQFNNVLIGAQPSLRILSHSLKFKKVDDTIVFTFEHPEHGKQQIVFDIEDYRTPDVYLKDRHEFYQWCADTA